MTKLSLKIDKNTVSGYQWTSAQGPPYKITNGTLCKATVVVKKQPPVTLVVPFLKKWLLGE